MAEVGFPLLIENMKELNMGLFLVWLLVLAITYGILNRTEAFGEDKSVNAVISIATAFLATFGIFSVIPIQFFSTALGYASVAFVVLLIFIVIVGMVGLTPSDIIDKLEVNYVIIGVAIAAGIAGYIGYISYPGGGPSLKGWDLQNLAATASIGLLLFWIMKWILTGED